MSVLLEFAIFPTDKGESVSKYVARSLDIIERSGVPYQLTPMGTVLEGEWNDVMSVVTACYERMNEDCGRISCSIKIDARKDGEERLSQKIEKIESILGRTLNH